MAPNDEELTGYRIAVDDKPFVYPPGAHRSIDYRSLIHDRVHQDYGCGVSKREFDYRDFFAASDSILDAQEALCFVETSDWPKDICERYIWLYGVLQALAIEWQGVIQILKCFALNASQFKQAVSHIIEIRVSVAGHPAKHDHKHLEVKGSTFLSRQKLTDGKFSVVTYPEEGGFKQQEIDIATLINEQALAVNRALSGVWRDVSKWETHP